MTAIQSNLAHRHSVSYSVLVEQLSDRSWMATTLNRLDCQAKGATREQAVHRLQQAIEQRLANGEIIQLEVDLPVSNHPLLELAGKYKDDPMFEEMVAEIERERREEAIEERPWMKFAGMFKDDPYRNEFLEDMASYRRELDSGSNDDREIEGLEDREVKP
jgi:predicted RNase H-like HicB family nuclease